MWVQGQKWRTVESLRLLHRQLKAAFPSAAPPATDVTAWGTIGDTAHASDSDHYPHYYSVLGSTAVVCAADWPHAPRLGLDCAVVCEALRQSRDPRIKYVIFNRRMFSSYPTSDCPAWTWRLYKYADTDPHDDHAHLSAQPTAAADSTTPWQIGIGGDDMGTIDPAQWKPLADTCDRVWLMFSQQLPALMAMLKAVGERVDIGPEELASVEAAARAGTVAAADDFVARVVAGLPEGTLTRDDVEAALRNVLRSV